MSGTGESTADFAGEEREFRIRLGEIRRIEQKAGNVGIGEIARRLARAHQLMRQLGPQIDLVQVLAAGVEIHADDVRETIYQGLIGRGMASLDATALVRREIDDRGMRGLLDNASTALVILLGAQAAPEGSTVGEPSAGVSPATRKRPRTSKTSTARAPS